MTIEDIRAAQSELEDAIKTLLAGFERKTTTSVDAITLSHAEYQGESRMQRTVIRVEIEIKI